MEERGSADATAEMAPKKPSPTPAPAAARATPASAPNFGAGAIVGGLIALLLIGWIGYQAGRYMMGGPDEGKLNGAGSGRGSVSALGRLVPEGGVIDIGGTTGDRVGKLLVTEGQYVHQGDELAQLATYPLRQDELKLAETRLAEAENAARLDTAYADAMVAEAEVAAREIALAKYDVTDLESKVALGERNLETTTRDLERLQGLSSEIVSPQEIEHQKLLVEQARSEVASGKAQLAKLLAAKETNQQLADAKLKTARANRERLDASHQLESARKNVELARAGLEAATIRAPHDGQVLEIVTREGESIGQLPILRLGDTHHMYAVAEVYETDVQRLKKGQRATVQSRALETELHGEVESIGVTVAKKEVMSLDPTQSADDRVVKVLIRLDEADSERAGRLVNLQVDVQIDTGPAQSPLAAAP